MRRSPSPEVVRGREARWLQVGGVLLLGGEPTVNTTLRGLAPPAAKPQVPAGAGEGCTHRGHSLTHTNTGSQSEHFMQARSSNDVNGVIFSRNKIILVWNIGHYKKTITKWEHGLPVSIGLSALRLSVLPLYGCPPKVIRTGCSDSLPALTDLRE